MPRVSVGGALALCLVAVGCQNDKPPNTAPLVAKLQASGKEAGAKRLQAACSNSSPCDCLRVAGREALDADLAALGRQLLQQPPKACAQDQWVEGMRAEALARVGELEPASQKANSALKSNPRDAHATYALALVAWRQGKTSEARTSAEKALSLGRGAEAQLLLGLIFFHEKKYDEARKQFSALQQTDAGDLRARFNLALVDHHQGKYRAAREGYLAVLKADPKHFDARYNLGVLTHGAGASDEAKHHLSKLEAAAGATDGRVKRLRALLAGAPPP